MAIYSIIPLLESIKRIVSYPNGIGGYGDAINMLYPL